MRQKRIFLNKTLISDNVYEPKRGYYYGGDQPISNIQKRESVYNI